MAATSTAARWESADLPTAAGARLGAGRLRLVEGLATVAFDSGAEVVLEGPAEFELIGAMRAALRRGTAVAEVADSASGFTIETPSANVIDHGTRFAVSVNPSTGATRTQVFDGHVEVERPSGGERVHLHSGQSNLAAADRLGDVGEGPEEAAWSPPPAVRRLAGPGWRLLSTADPGGADGYAAATHIPEHSSEELLLVKRGLVGPRSAHRKAYLRFSLAPLDGVPVAEAELILTFVPTGWGLASHVDDAEFEVWGVTDDSLDGWSRDSLTWENAPASLPGGGGGMDPGRAVPLGTFTLPRGVQSGSFGISGEALAEFLNSVENGLATLALVRNTAEDRGGGLVHGVAGALHPSLPAPRLAVRAAE